MSRKTLFLLSEGGTGNTGSHGDWGGNIALPAQAQISDTNNFETVVWQVPFVNSYDHYGALPSFPANTVVANLWAAYLTPIATFTAVAGAGLTLRVYRAGTLLGTSGHQEFMGWNVSEAAETGGIPSIAAWQPTSLPWITGYTGTPAVTAPANQVLSATVGYLGLYPGDVITAFYNNQSDGNWTPPAFNLQLSLT